MGCCASCLDSEDDEGEGAPLTRRGVIENSYYNLEKIDSKSAAPRLSKTQTDGRSQKPHPPPKSRHVRPRPNRRRREDAATVHSNSYSEPYVARVPQISRLSRNVYDSTDTSSDSSIVTWPRGKGKQGRYKSHSSLPIIADTQYRRGVRTDDVEAGEASGSHTSSGHTDHAAYEANDDGPVESEMVDDYPLVGSADEDDVVIENLAPPEAGPALGDLELAFQYNGEARRMNVTIIKCHGLPKRDQGGASSWRLRLLLLPSRRQRAKTHIRESQDPLFKELFRFSRIFPHEVVSTALRCRLYTCERLRKERLVGESLIKFSSLNIATKQIIKVAINARSDSSKDNSSPYSSTSDLSDTNSTSSMQSLSHGSVPELLVGLTYNATTGRLDVEVIKGSHFKQRAAGRAPDSYVKVALMSSSGFEISKSKTSVRRSQSGPTFKETFFFQVAQFQLPEMTLLFSVFNKKGIKRKESIGWFSMGLSNSSEEEIGHWNEMRESKGHQVCRWHVLLES